MTRLFRTLAIAVALGSAATAYAQSPAKATGQGPIGRGDNVFYYPLSKQPATGALDNTGIGRPTPRSGVAVTPVPEPSQWAMMLAGLALVGFIVRRNAKRS